MKVKWLELALDDLDSAIGYIKIEDPEAAQRVAQLIWHAGDLLKDNPKIGRIGRIKNSREWVVNQTSYIIAYRIKNNMIEILRIIHGRQSWPDTLD